MTKRAKELINAISLGDGHIRRQGNCYSLCVRHGAGQEELINTKAKWLMDELGIRINVSPFINNGYPAFRFQVATKYNKFTHGWLYHGTSKIITLSFLRRLTDEGVAIWYMDDGSLTRKKRHGRTHAYDLVISLYATEREANDCIVFFRERYGVGFKLKRNKGKFSIRCGTQEARKLLYRIGAYIIPSMSYKTFTQEPSTAERPR